MGPPVLSRVWNEDGVAATTGCLEPDTTGPSGRKLNNVFFTGPGFGLSPREIAKGGHKWADGPGGPAVGTVDNHKVNREDYPL